MFTQSGKTRDNEGEKNRIDKTPELTFTTSTEIIVGKNYTMQETLNAPHKLISNRIQKHQVRQNK